MAKFFPVHASTYDDKESREVCVLTSDVSAISWGYREGAKKYVVIFMLRTSNTATFLYNMYDTEDECVVAYNAFMKFVEENQ